MPNETLWTVVGTAAALLTVFGFVPQIIKMWRSGSVGNVSPVTLYQFTAGVVLWALYGVSRKDPVVITANVVTLFTLSIALVLYHRSPFARRWGWALTPWSPFATAVTGFCSRWRARAATWHQWLAALSTERLPGPKAPA